MAGCQSTEGGPGKEGLTGKECTVHWRAQMDRGMGRQTKTNSGPQLGGRDEGLLVYNVFGLWFK